MFVLAQRIVTSSNNHFT